jgi:hypothetical protein
MGTPANRFETWRTAFADYLAQTSVGAMLKSASLAEDLQTWTNELTTAVVRSCEAVGWMAAAKWNPCRRLPKGGQEYLGIDVMAFPPTGDAACRWPLPVAVFELEHARSADRVAYSLWKVLCIRAELRVVFAYRPDWERSRQLIQAIAADVIGGLSPEQRLATHGQTVLVVGNRGEGETFPWGFFKCWLLNVNLGRFEKV